jgi:hypothetical protein
MTVALAMAEPSGPDPQIVANLEKLIASYEALAEHGRKPGIGNYAVKRLPVLRERLANLRAGS